MNSFDHQVLYGYAFMPGSPAVHDDIALDKPVLQEPADAEVMCISSNYADANSVDLEWGQVAKADFYVVQWCTNSSFAGPTIKAVKVAKSADPESLTLDTPDDIRYGETYYWRVMAYSTAGGAGPKSDVWSFKLECESEDPDDNSGDDRTDCGAASVKMTIKQYNDAKCNKQVGFKLDFSHDDSWALDTLTWSVESGEAVIVRYILNELVIKPTGCESQEVVVQALLKLTKDAQTLECKKKLTVDVDCDVDNEFEYACAPHGTYRPGGAQYLKGCVYTEKVYGYSEECGEYYHTYEYATVQFPNLGGGLYWDTGDDGVTSLNQGAAGIAGFSGEKRSVYEVYNAGNILYEYYTTDTFANGLLTAVGVPYMRTLQIY